jgi:hypothetical protein
MPQCNMMVASPPLKESSIPVKMYAAGSDFGRIGAEMQHTLPLKSAETAGVAE